MVLAVALAGGALAAGLVPGVKEWFSSGSIHNDPANASYLNGATREWVFDLEEKFPGEEVRFTFGQNTDDAGSPFRFGPVDAGDVYVLPYRTKLNTTRTNLIAIDAETGKELWRRDDHHYETCVARLPNGVIACAVYGDGEVRLMLLEGRTGHSKTVGPFRGTFGYLEALEDRIVLAAVTDSTISFWGFDASGSQLWTTTEESVAPQDLSLSEGIPMTAAGRYLNFRTLTHTWVVDTRSGDMVVDTPGSGTVTPSGHFIPDKAPDSPVPDPGRLNLLDWGGDSAVLTEPDSRGRQVLFRMAAASTSVCEEQDPTRCRTIDSPGGRLEPTTEPIVESNGHLFATAWIGDFNAPAAVDLDSSRAGDGWDQEGFGDQPVTSNLMAPGPAAVMAGGGQLAIVTAMTGQHVAEASLPGWTPVPRMPRRLLLGYSADPNEMMTKLASFAPATSRQGIVIPGTTSTTQTTLSVPAEIPACPAGTVMLAWATFPQGWILVCGVNAETPSFWTSSGTVVPGESRSVTWDGTTSRYVATMADGSREWLSFGPPCTAAPTLLAGLLSSATWGGSGS